MNYSDDGRTLDYDLLKACYPNHDVDPEPYRPSPQKLAKSASAAKGSINSKPTSGKGKKSLIHHLDMEDPESLFDALEDDENDLNKSRKRAEINSKDKTEGKAKRKPYVKRKKLKIEGLEEEGKLWNDEAEVDSTKDTSTQSVASEVLNENINKKQTRLAKEIKGTKAKKGISKKQKQKDAAVINESLVKEIVVPPSTEEKNKANYLINAIPCFFEKFRTENMYSINRSFYFDPINLSL